LLSPAKVKEKALKALFARKLIEKGWLSALLGYLAKKDELKIRLNYMGDVTLRKTDFEALVINAYYTAKCWPRLPEELARTAGSLLKPQDAFPWLVSILSLASYLCDKSRKLCKKVSISASPDRLSLEVNGVSVAFNPRCVVYPILETFLMDEYEIPEVLSGLRGRDVIDVGGGRGRLSALLYPQRGKEGDSC
jgi:hypothetical protein